MTAIREALAGITFNHPSGKKHHEKVSQARAVATLDFETDPFTFGLVPRPFVAGYFDGSLFVPFWGDDCVERLVSFLSAIEEPQIIYAHNGGKFDFIFLLAHLSSPIKIVRGRILSARLGRHELRDSYALAPVALDQFQKDDIDYRKFTKARRNKYRGEIVAYLENDCRYLHTLVSGFRSRHGDRLTIGGASLRSLKAIHPCDSQGPYHDARFRPHYFGGRVECFESGELRGDFKVYDVNSMYPAVMRDLVHPTGNEYSIFTSFDMLERYGRDLPFFVHWRGFSAGAVPLRDTTGRLTFPIGEGEFRCTSHEFWTALDLGLIHPDKIIRADLCENKISFGAFVDEFSGEKIAAKARGDKVAELIAKLTLNSAYGRFALNPENFRDYFIRTGDSEPPIDRAADHGPVPFDMQWHRILSFPGGEIYSKPATRKTYVDVATAASITGGARAVLLRAISHACRPIYCDTDSLICESLGEGVEIHASKLGAWKFEGEIDHIAIAGKKTYAAFHQGKVIKVASKGWTVLDDNKKDQSKLAKIIVDISRGLKYHHQNAAPNFKLNGEARFVERIIQRT